MEFPILGLEINLRLKSIGIPVQHSTPDRLGLYSRAGAHSKEEELLYPVKKKKKKRIFQIPIQIFSYLESSFNFFSSQFSLFFYFFDRLKKKNSRNKVRNIFLLRYRMALPLSNEPLNIDGDERISLP